MRNVYLICYDISHDKRRTKVFNCLKGFGFAVQFSVFHCALTDSELLRLRTEIWNIVKLDEDRILLADLGPEDGRGKSSLENWGVPLEEISAPQKPYII
ncbi:MAG: CRISPR-associated endonuclease Cas2 [Zavarzinella sp.]